MIPKLFLTRYKIKILMLVEVIKYNVLLSVYMDMYNMNSYVERFISSLKLSDLFIASTKMFTAFSSYQN